MKKITVIFAIMAVAFSAKAERVSYKDAEQAAKAYYHQTVNAFRATEWNDINLTCVVNPNETNAKYNLYIFDVNENEGFVVVSSDNQISPVLAYSFENGFNIDNMSPGQADYMKYYSESNDYASKNSTEYAEKMQAQWNDLLTYTPNMRATRDVQTSPILLDGIVWEQGWPFNSECPTVSSGGEHGRAYVGCVATAACHVMKYWSWPETGNGSKTSYNSLNGGHGNITVNFANQHYDWTAMADNPSNDENEEIGKICFHLGVATAMEWNPLGSGTQTEELVDALRVNFKYSTEIAHRRKSYYSETTWNAMLKEQIDGKYPMVYAGTSYSASAGHAWNCDGYQITDGVYKFHMNWGWGANGGNGFYTLDNLVSTATAGGEENNFSSNQRAIINIYPNQSFSSCQNLTITGSEGTFDDGSRINNYVNNKDCSYTINPECGHYVEISFSKFDLAEGDYVQIIEGDENSTDIITSFDMNNLPSGKISTTEGALTLKFHTDGSQTADGWRLDYKTYYCKDDIVVTKTKASGVIEDGSESCQYKSNVICRWMIAPENATSITIDFDEFNVAGDNKDYVGLYRNEIGNSNLVAKYMSSNLPTEPITIEASVVGVKFYSNANEEIADGWKLTYSSTTNAIEEIKILSNLSVVPNPANNDSRIAFTLTDCSNASITITNIMGQIVATNNFELGSGYHEIPVNSFSNVDWQNGVYFVNVKSGNEMKTCKFVYAE